MQSLIKHDSALNGHDHQLEGPAETAGTTGFFGDFALLRECLSIILRHKWKVMFLGLLGMGGAVWVYFHTEPVYESKVKLLVRYVLERSVIDSEVGSEVQRSDGRRSMNVIRDEMEILTSWDLAKAVVDSVGERLMPEPSNSKEPPTPMQLATSIIDGLLVENSRNSNVISVTYQNRKPEMAVEVLNTLINEYFDKHLEIHRSMASAEFITGQTADVSIKLEDIESELNELKAEAGIVSISGNTSGSGNGARSGSPGGDLQSNSWSWPPEEWALARADLLAAEIEGASQMARLRVLEGFVGGTESNINGEPQPDENDLAKYRALVDTLTQLRERHINLRGKFPPGNRLILGVTNEIAAGERERQALARTYPSLVTIATATTQENGGINMDSERAQVAATEARIGILQEKVKEIERLEQHLPSVISRILTLERIKKVEEEKFGYYSSAVEKAKIDELLDPSKMPNISVVQSAANAVPVIQGSARNAMVLFAGGGLGLGILLAFIIELFIDRRVKRASETEERFHLSLMLSIPILPTAWRALSFGRDADTVSGLETSALLEGRERFVQYAAAIRDHLFSHFYFAPQSEKGAKLVAFTSVTRGAGVTSLACSLSGLASMNGEKVLFVDMNAEWDEPFSVYQTEQKLKDEAAQQSQELALSENGSSEHGPITPRHLHSILPLLRESEYEYVIFDMPMLEATSPAGAMAGFMDKVILVLDATGTDRDVLKQGCDQLARVNADVGCVFNKSPDARHIEKAGKRNGAGKAGSDTKKSKRNAKKETVECP